LHLIEHRLANAVVGFPLKNDVRLKCHATSATGAAIIPGTTNTERGINAPAKTQDIRVHGRLGTARKNCHAPGHALLGIIWKKRYDDAMILMPHRNCSLLLTPP
jgi:hypothetical protein